MPGKKGGAGVVQAYTWQGAASHNSVWPPARPFRIISYIYGRAGRRPHADRYLQA
jgi:hypothetical protein